MLKTATVAIVVAVAALLLYAATRPDRFAVQRTAAIAAPADKIHPLIDDLHRFNSWNPFEKKDPNLKVTYRGAQRGAGAAYDFAGNAEVGSGSIEIVESAAPNKVTMKLTMTEPMKAHNTVVFTLAPRGDATEVTWSMQGDSPFLAKLIGVFVDMDKMVGREFEAGLANLKTLAERTS